VLVREHRAPNSNPEKEKRDRDSVTLETSLVHVNPHRCKGEGNKKDNTRPERANPPVVGPTAKKEKKEIKTVKLKK